MNLGRGPAIQRAVRAFLVVEPEIRRQPLFECWYRAIFTQIDILVLDAAPESFNKTLSNARLRPSMLIRIWFSSSRPVKSTLVNWRPWSLLKIHGWACDSA